MDLPQMALITQEFDRTRVEDIDGAVASELERIDIAARIEPGAQVGITAGSRGVTNIAAITKAVVSFLKRCGARPFVFPAMGSHAGASAAGQKQLLAGYGITEEAMGCPILSTMEVVEIGRTPEGLPVFLDRFARAADHLVVINRVKPHTKFKGPIESGLMKMMAIGMGKQHGADLYHKAFVQFGPVRVIESVARVVMAASPILCGLGVVENGYEETAIIRAVLTEDLLEEEKRLLVEARRRLPRIPFSEVDLLIVDEMGKNISGTGMDTNVTGVNRDLIGTFDAGIKTRRLFVRDLTPETAGNAVGIGFADFTTTRLVEKIDRQKTYINCITGISPEKGAIPIYFDTDRECIEAAISCLGMVEPEKLKIVHIKNTLTLDRLYVSKSYLDQITAKPNLRLASAWRPFAFDAAGNLISPFQESQRQDSAM